MNFHEVEFIENIIKQEIHEASINESKYLLKTVNPPKYPTQNSLNDINIENSNDRQQQPDPNDSTASFRIVPHILPPKDIWPNFQETPQPKALPPNDEIPQLENV